MHLLQTVNFQQPVYYPTVVSFNVPSSTGIFDVTGSFTWTPVAALFIGSGAGSSGAGTANNLRMCVGATDGTNQWAAGWQSVHGFGNSVAYSWWATDEVLVLPTQFNDPEYEVNFDSWLPGGARLNVGQTFGSSHGCMAVFFPPTWEAVVGTKTPTNTLAGSVTVSGIGFQSDLVIGAMSEGTASLDTRTSDASISFGAWDGTRQRGLVWFEDTGLSTTSVSAVARTDHMLQELDTINLQNDARYEFANLGSDGWDIITRSTSGSVTADILYLALKSPDSVAVNSFDMPASTGDQDFTSAGFKPKAGIICSGMVDGEDTVDFDNSAEAFSICAFDKDNIRSIVASAEDGAGTTNTSTTVADKFQCRDEDADNDRQATFVEFLSNGYRLNFDTVSGADTDHGKGFEIVFK